MRVKLLLDAPELAVRLLVRALVRLLWMELN